MSGLQQNFLSALNQSFQFGQNIKANRDRNQLAQLSSQAYSAAPEQRQQIYGQMAAINPQAAQQQEQAFASADDRRNQSLANAARLLMSAPEQYRPGIYQQMRTGLSNFIPNLPEQYDQSVAQAAQSIAQAYGNLDKQTPTDVRSFQMMTAGLSPEDRERARRVNLGLDGRASSSGFSQVKVTGADGRERVGVLNGRTGQIDLPDGTSFNPNTGAITPTQGGQALPQGGGQQVLDQDAVLANQMIAAGIPEAQVDAFLAQRAASFGGGQPQMFAPSQNPSAFVGRAPEEQAAATEAAKLGVQNANFGNELEQQRLLQEQQARIDTQRAGSVEQIKSQAERQSNERAKTAQLNNVDRGLDRIDRALSGLTGNYVDTGPIDGQLIRFSERGQELENAVGAIQNDMLALTRVPGIGAQSDLEARIANLKYPSIYNHPDVNARNVQQLKAFMADLRRQITGSGQQQGPAPQQAAGQRTVTRRGRTPDGRTVVQYSDGAIEYGN